MVALVVQIRKPCERRPRALRAYGKRDSGGQQCHEALRNLAAGVIARDCRHGESLGGCTGRIVRVHALDWNPGLAVRGATSIHRSWSDSRRSCPAPSRLTDKLATCVGQGAKGRLAACIPDYHLAAETSSCRQLREGEVRPPPALRLISKRLCGDRIKSNAALLAPVFRWVHRSWDRRETASRIRRGPTITRCRSLVLRSPS